MESRENPHPPAYSSIKCSHFAVESEFISSLHIRYKMCLASWWNVFPRKNWQVKCSSPRGGEKEEGPALLLWSRTRPRPYPLLQRNVRFWSKQAGRKTELNGGTEEKRTRLYGCFFFYFNPFQLIFEK
jgi:hypothetical protein